MFQEQQRMTYQSIRAPEELREKIMAKKKPAQKRLPMYLTTALAACLVLAIGIGIFFPGGNAPQIAINGQQLKDTIVYYDVVTASDMRSAPVLAVPVDLELSEESQISVSCGNLVWEGETPVDQLTASEDVSLIWQLPKDEQPVTCEMTIKTGSTVTTLTLQYDQSEIKITKKGE